MPMQLPDAVDASPTRTLAEYWRDRLRQHVQDTYKDHVLAKLPEDLRTYQHVIWQTQPRCIIELGTYDGGSALWFADQLRSLVSGTDVLVVTVDVRPRRHVAVPGLIEQIEGDLSDPAVVSAVHGLASAAGPAMVVEDAAHTYECTLSALTLYSDLVSPSCYFVVEDAIVDDGLALPEWYGCHGVRRAIDEFLVNHAEFQREFLAPYGLTTDQGGWLRCAKADAEPALHHGEGR